ncbi:TIGR02594 family protein [Rhizobium sp. P38BS-XIX]|uniref:TIGR02594 family protein n=1 Tax=Rhizobium sp. P38BS-XIX TaxID=2726740 RepID=UPI001456E9ED|nr:TIGR02594 family protein [Rhizobium sp. P38BS-XIX]NLS00199.1 TIGR02594 family protein [Rhizobium sp. P38BS-XIX]
MQTFDDWLIARLTAWRFYKSNPNVSTARAISTALTAFQAASKITITGTATTETINALRVVPPAGNLVVPPVPANDEPAWMREARRFMGLKEIPGPRSNPTIITWAQKLGGWMKGYYTNDDIPWCGLFMAHCIGATLPSENLPSNPLGALNWSTFGKRLTVPVLGAILTFKRTGGGHVGLYAGENAKAFRVLGGNQGNSVSLSWVEKARLQDMRWPITGEAPIGGRVWLTIDGELSKNEA